MDDRIEKQAAIDTIAYGLNDSAAKVTMGEPTGTTKPVLKQVLTRSKAQRIDEERVLDVPLSKNQSRQG